MKIGKYPVASIALLLVFGVELAIKYFYPAKYESLSPVFDNILLALVIIFTLYYIRIWVGALLNKRNEQTEPNE